MREKRDMVEQEKISVIVPVYNAETYLNNTLEDLCNQTYSNIEIFLVDDGSTDKSWSIIQEYEKKDIRIKAIKIKNSGPSKARNIGLEMASGEYIRFIDADDRIPLDSMEKMIKIYQNNKDVDLVVGNYICQPMKNYFTGDVFQEGRVEPEKFVCHFIKFMKSFYYGVPWNKLYKNEIVSKYKIRFDESVIWCEDFLFNIEYFDKCKGMYYINSQNGIYKYCIRENGITGELVDKKKCVDFKRISSLRYDKAKQYCKQFGLEELFELEWKCASLYDELSAATKKKYSKSYRKRYQKFKELLCKEGVYQYVCIRQESFDLKVWKYIKKAIEKKRFLGPFMLFLFKGYMVTYFNGIMPILRKCFQPLLPKSL